MTRQDATDQTVIKNCQDLQFLVLDELHTYRGRQGADVALLVRRIRALLAPKGLQCIGTSATMASGSAEDRRTAVASVASKLFGVSVLPLHQFISGAGTAYATIESPAKRTLTVNAQQFLPEHPEKRL